MVIVISMPISYKMLLYKPHVSELFHLFLNLNKCRNIHSTIKYSSLLIENVYT